MSKNVKTCGNGQNKDSVSDNSVMSKIACHYVSLPKVILRRIDDPLFSSTLNIEENKVLKSVKKFNKPNIKKLSPKSKNIPAKNFTTKTSKKKNTLQTKKAVSTLLQGAGKKTSRIKQTLTKSKLTKELASQRLSKKFINKTSVKSNRTTEKKSRGRPKKELIESYSPVVKKARKSEVVTKPVYKRKPQIVKNSVVLTTPEVATKTLVKTTPQANIEQLNREMSIKDDDSILEELENSDSEKSFEEPSDVLYNELIESLESNPRQIMADPSIKKETLSKNVIKLSSRVQKTPGAVIKGGIIRKNTIPIQAKSKPSMKPNQMISSVNFSQIKNMSSGNMLDKQKMLISPIQNVKQKQLLSQTSKPKSPVPQIKRKAIRVQSVEAINSKAKKPEISVQATPKITATKQTATVTPLTKARKSFTSGPPKVNFNNKISKENEPVDVVESEPVNLLSKLVGLPISASKLQVVSLSPQNTIQMKPSSSPPPLASIKNDISKTQYVTPTTHDKELANKNALDLLKILGDDEPSTSQQVRENNFKNSSLNIINGNEMRNSSKLSSSVQRDETSMDTDENEMGEERQRTIYDLMADINLVYPSWNLHIMPDTNSFCIAQISRGRLGIPVLKKCIELDEAYNAKVYVHQYHCKRFDGQYDSEESIIALIHEINALRA